MLLGEFMSTLAVNVLVKDEQGGMVSAMVLGLPEYRVVSIDRPSAIAELEKLLAETLSGTELVKLEVEIPKRDHPWQRFAGIYKDSNLFESVLESIAVNRLDLNVRISHDSHDGRKEEIV